MPETTLREHLSKAGSAKTPKKREAALANLVKANAKLSPQDRARNASKAAAARWTNHGPKKSKINL